MNRFAFAMLVGFSLFMSFSVVAYSFSKCGWDALWMGKFAIYAALSGACDE